MVASAAEDLLAMQLKALGIEHEREFRFASPRRWRADFRICGPVPLLVEVEGTTYFGKNKNGTMRLGRHQTAKGFAEDCVKYNAAAEIGYLVLRYTAAQIKSGAACAQIERMVLGAYRRLSAGAFA